jgi:RHS repeat-associated protein
LGQVFHPTIGLASTHFRWFDAGIARWLSADPISLRGGPDHHGFDGSPTERTDPEGLFTAASFQAFLNRTHAPRVAANAAAVNVQNGGDPNVRSAIGGRTSAASVPIPPPPGAPGAPGAPATSLNTGAGTPESHAERDPLRAAQGGGGPGPAGSGAIGAGRPHCGGCTNAIINTPGAVPSSRIRGDNGNGNNGFAIPPVTNPGGFDP